MSMVNAVDELLFVFDPCFTPGQRVAVYITTRPLICKNIYPTFQYRGLTYVSCRACVSPDQHGSMSDQ